MKSSFIIALAVLAPVMVLRSQGVETSEPRFTAEGQLMRPENYREWIFLSSGLGMTYGTGEPRGEPRFDNVFVNREAFAGFLQTGTWPDKTIFILEVRDSGSHASINTWTLPLNWAFHKGLALPGMASVGQP